MGGNDSKDEQDQNSNLDLNSNDQQNYIINNMLKRIYLKEQQKLLQNQEKSKINNKDSINLQNNEILKKPQKTSGITTTVNIKQNEINLIQKQSQENASKIDQKNNILNTQNQQENSNNNIQPNQIQQSLQQSQQQEENISVPTSLFQERLFSLPNSVIHTIIKFLINQYKQLQLVSPLWYYKINESFEDTLIHLDNKFIKKYMSILDFKNSYLSYSPIYANKQNGFRLDRYLIAEVLPAYKNKQITIAYTYTTQSLIIKNQAQLEEQKHQNSQQPNEIDQQKDQTHKEIKGPRKYLSEFKFDVLENEERIIWIYKEDCKHNFDKNKLAFIQPIIPIYVGDLIKISVNLYNMNGLVDIDSIQWKTPRVDVIPEIPIQLDPNQFNTYDKNRICEIEEIYTNWILYKYFNRNEKIELNIFEPYLELLETRCAGVDIITSKSIYKAKKPGVIENSLQHLGVQVQVVGKKKQISAEIKRIGLYQDLQHIIYLKVGDTLVFYVSKGD